MIDVAADWMAWLYVVTNSLRVFFYAPQIRAVLKAEDGARAVSIVTWSFWTFAHLTAMLYGWFVMPESLPPERRTRHAVRNPFAALAVLNHYTLAKRLAIALFLANMAQFLLHSTWALYTAHRYGWMPSDVGWSLFAVGVGGAIVQGGVTRRVVPRLGERRSILIGLALASVPAAARP